MLKVLVSLMSFSLGINHSHMHAKQAPERRVSSRIVDQNICKHRKWSQAQICKYAHIRYDSWNVHFLSHEASSESTIGRMAWPSTSFPLVKNILLLPYTCSLFDNPQTQHSRKDMRTAYKHQHKKNSVNPPAAPASSTASRGTLTYPPHAASTPGMQSL